MIGDLEEPLLAGFPGVAVAAGVAFVAGISAECTVAFSAMHRYVEEKGYTSPRQGRRSRRPRHHHNLTTPVTKTLTPGESRGPRRASLGFGSVAALGV